ncbi:MAG: hypothetical protein U0360_05800 [Dehalococcoidia bacterium]
MYAGHGSSGREDGARAGSSGRRRRFVTSETGEPGEGARARLGEAAHGVVHRAGREALVAQAHLGLLRVHVHVDLVEGDLDADDTDRMTASGKEAWL